MVQKRRHLAKALTYRLMGSTVTACLIFAVSGSITISLVLGGADTLAKILIYYVHERAWYGIKWGVTDEDF